MFDFCILLAVFALVFLAGWCVYHVATDLRSDLREDWTGEGGLRR